MIVYKTIVPSAKLAAYVKFFWIFEADNLEDSLVHTSTASICPKLTFNYTGGFREETEGVYRNLFAAGLQGQTNKHCKLVTESSSIGVFGVYFFPFALPLLFSIPASAFSNEVISLQELLGARGLELEERVVTARSHNERILIVSAFLERLADDVKKTDRRLIKAVDYLATTKAPVDFKAIASNHFLSQRQFERKFKETTGFNPKLFSRISRFEEAINDCIMGHSSLTEIAYSCGYYDQSHFIRDFKSFTGQHPTAYLSNREYISLFS